MKRLGNCMCEKFRIRYITGKSFPYYAEQKTVGWFGREYWKVLGMSWYKIVAEAYIEDKKNKEFLRGKVWCYDS